MLARWMATRVFISYRREDSAAFAGRVHDRLRSEFGREALFMDVDTVRLRMDFVEVISEQVAECDALLAVIGPNWLNARDEEGSRRLDDPNAFPRIEIAAALERDIPVIPILVDGTKIPRADQLPKELKGLAHCNALEGDCQTRCERSNECRIFSLNKSQKMCNLYTRAKLQSNLRYDTGLRQ
jgi:hypothetical protein